MEGNSDSSYLALNQYFRIILTIRNVLISVLWKVIIRPSHQQHLIFVFYSQQRLITVNIISLLYLWSEEWKPPNIRIWVSWKRVAECRHRAIGDGSLNFIFCHSIPTLLTVVLSLNWCSEFDAIAPLELSSESTKPQYASPPKRKAFDPITVRVCPDRGLGLFDSSLSFTRVLWQIQSQVDIAVAKSKHCSLVVLISRRTAQGIYQVSFCKKWRL